MKTKIPWCDETINPIHVSGVSKVWPHGHHCTKCSPGCKNCYAEGLNMRFGTGFPYDDRDVEFGLDLSIFDKLPKKSRRVFVQSMGDLFHRCVPFDLIDDIFDEMAQRSIMQGHTFLLLTKRPLQLKEYYRQAGFDNNYHPQKFVHLGVTVCNQKEADEKIPILLSIPAAVRFVSIEPMLGPVDLSEFQPFRSEKHGPTFDGVRGLLKPLHWIILGCESGSERRPCDPMWMRKVAKQCKDSEVACFVKQVDLYGKLVKDINKFHFPELQVQEFPKSNP